MELARGLLIHHVVLDAGDEDWRVLDCHVIAPTEWNFHPDGAVAHALDELAKRQAGPWPLASPGEPTGKECTEPGPGGPPALAVLLAAYDPCVPFRRESAANGALAHA